MLHPAEEHLVKETQLRFGIPRDQAERLYAVVFIMAEGDMDTVANAISGLHELLARDEMPQPIAEKLAMLGIRFPARVGPL